MKYLFRIITLPFYIVLLIIAQLRFVFIHSYNWILYGGEAVAYQKEDRKMIYDNHKMLSELLEINKEFEREVTDNGEF